MRLPFSKLWPFSGPFQTLANESQTTIIISILKHPIFYSRPHVLENMGGLLSPDRKSVLHEDIWVQAILSPDESMYYHEGEWYNLNQDVSNTIQTGEKPSLEKPENQVVETISTYDGKVDNQKIIAAIASLFLLWVIFDSGSIFSYADIASMDCSGWDDFDDFFETNTQEDCKEAKNGAMAIVLAAGFGVLVCLRYIFSESQNDLKTRSGIGETPRPLNQEEIDADRLQLEQRAKERELEREIVRCQDEAKFLRRRISLCKSIESAKEELDTARSNWDSVQDEWGPKYSEIIERRNLFTRITLVVLILGSLISFTIYALISATEDVVPEDTLGAIFPYVFYASWLCPLLLFMVMNSNRVVDKEDPLLILRDSIPELERQIEGENGTLNSLDSRGISIKRFGDALNLSTEDMVEMLEERESFIMNESKGD